MKKMKKFNYLIIMLVLLLAMNVMGQNTQSGSVVIDDGVITSSTNLQRDLPEKFVVFEELTGCWCHWCTGGIAYSWLLHENFDNVLFIAIHCSDPMAYDEYTEATGLTGAPTADVNRIQQGIGIGQWVNAATNNSAVVPPANVSVETVWNESTRELEVNLSAYFFENLSGDYRLGGVLIEDAVTGPSPQYNQSNHYGGGTTPMYGFEKMPSDIPAYMIAYDHVARQLLGEYGGDEGSLPAFINAGETHNYSYVITVPEEWDQEYVRVIGWLTSNTGQTIQNANKSLYLPGYDNAKPKFTSTPETFAYEGVDYNYDIFTHDTDQEEMTILEVNLPDWLTFEVLGDSAAVISGSTNNIGSYSAEVSVSDGNYTIYQTWEIEVYPSGQFFPPTNLTATVFNENDVELNWDIEVLPDLLSFDIYRNGFFYDNTTEVTYEDIDVVIGTYGYYVVAVYLGGESEPTDIVSVQISPPVLAPPTNLEIEADLNNVSLNWVSPGGGGGSEYLRYDNEENTASLQIGNVAPAIRWDAGGLSDYDGYILQKIKFFVGDVASASFTLKVWEGENGSNPLVSQEISGVIAGWNEFDLDYPVTIDGTKEYWIGYDIVDGMGAYIPGYNSSIPVVDGYGNMLFYYNTWHTTSEGNWNIAGYVVDAKGNGEYVGEDLLSFNVYRNDALIAEDITTTTYLDNDLENGSYEYYVTAVYEEGESDPSNEVEIYINISPGDGFSLYHNGEPFAPGGTLELQDDVTVSEIVSHMAIENNFDETKNVLVSKEIIIETTGQTNVFCWGICYAPNIYVSTEVISLASGELNEDDFSGHLMPNGIEGVTIIKYTFFEENNPEVSIHFFAKYIAGDPPTVEPPTNLVAEVIYNDVYLSWFPPGSGGSEYLRYDDEVNTGSLQIGDVAPAIRWDAGGLSDYDGYILQKIKFYVGSVASATFTLKVWEGENGSNSLVSQEISGVIAGWNEFDLDYPVTIDGTKEYWIGYDIVNGSGASIPGFNSSIPIVDGYANMLFYYGTWHTNNAGNWNIAGYVFDTKGNGEYLGEDLLSYNVYRNDEPEPIANVTEIDYFDASLPSGTYEYYVTAVYDEGESGPSNIVVAIVLDAPTNLVAEVIDDDDVNLTWDAPGPSGGEYLRYDNDENTASLQIGNVAPAIRWDTGGLSDYDGYILQKIKFFVGDVASASFTLKVWEGENGSNPLVSQEISGVIAGWNEFDLDYPVTIDGTKEYWIGYDIVDGMGAYIPGYNSSIPVVDGYGNMLFYYNTWHTTSEGNWNIAGYVVDAKGNGEYLGEDLLSYNVYRNDELIANVTETDYFDENLDNGIYEYYVTALYDEGESGATNIVEVNIGETLCTPLYASGCAMGDGFMDFALNEIQNYQTGCANLTGLGWSQYLELGPAIIEPDETYTLAIGSGFNNQYATVWVDWNDNLQFEEDEIVVDNFIMIDLSTVYDVDFVVPADAPSGLHFMRGRTNWNAPCTDPCSSYTYGEAEDYMVFVSSSTETQEIPLSSGYSFVSSRIIPNNPDMLIVMADVLNDNLDFVRNSQGLMLRKIGPNWVNGIGDWIVEEGYLVKMFVDDLLTTSGTSVDPTTPISVVTGYQFVSYFPADPMDALSAFGSIIGDDLDFIRNSQGNMLRKIGPNWVNGIGDALPGEGYLVKMFAAGEIVYPEVAKSSGKVNAIPAHFRFEGGNAADPVFTLFITGLEIGDEVGAYDGEKLVGAMKVNSLNVLDNDLPVFNTINSGHGYTSGNPIILKVWSNNELVNVDFTMETVFDSYVSKVYPDEDGAFSVVNVKSSINLNNEIMVYPNPATDEINISSSEAVRNVMILNHAGQLVYDGKSEKINVSNFNSGVYIIRIKTDNGITTKKLTIK